MERQETWAAALGAAECNLRYVDWLPEGLAAVRGLRATFEELVTGSGAVGLDAITAGKFIRYVRVGPVVQVIILMG